MYGNDKITGHEQSISIETVPVVGTDVIVGLMMSFPRTVVVNKKVTRQEIETRTILLDLDGLKRLVSILSSYAISADNARPLCAFNYNGECQCIRPEGHRAPHRCQHD